MVFGNDIKKFLEGGKILKLIDFISLEEETIAYVLGCFYGVAQGIDFINDEKTKPNPRYYLEIKVGDELNELDFFLCDDVVKKVAPLTCIKLEKKNGPSTLYPDELEQMLGDAILFKVKKDQDCDSCGAISVQILDFLIDSNLMDVYLNPTHTLYASNETVNHNIKPHVFDSQVLSSGTIAAKCPQLIVPPIQSYIQSNCPVLDEFVGNVGIKRLSELSMVGDVSKVIVIGWYESVFEGIDMWYPDDKYLNQPRFRLKINVRDENIDTNFTLFDEQVKNIAFDTCGVLTSIGESASMYPNELDILYGDPILLKVVRQDLNDSADLKEYEIVEMLTDPFILDKFFQCYMPTFGAFDNVAGKRSPVCVCDAFSSTESENLSEESHYFERKREDDTTLESAVQSDASTSSKRHRII